MSTNCNIKWDNGRLYNHLKKLKHKIQCQYSPTYLRQEDFKEGTYIIDKPGNYVLKENIVFNPNPDNDWMPRQNQPQYSDPAFMLGFFAAIVVKSTRVVINLNGKSISQSPEHAIQQRFYANIELGSSPFLPGQGPGNFATKFKAAKDVIICNGTLGRSSHHGIHGNNAVGVLVHKVVMKDFEFVGSALNGGGCHLFRKVKIGRNFQDVPILATYSAARFIRLFSQHLLLSHKLSQEDRDELEQKLAYLNTEMDIAFTEIMETGYTNNPLFRNESRLPDGNVYGILFHTVGVAIGDFADSTKKFTKNVFLEKVLVKKLKAKVDEIIALSDKNGEGAQVDTAGAVLQIDKITDKEGFYNGTVLSDLQIYLAKLKIKYNLNLGTLNITEDVVIWSENDSVISEVIDQGYVYRTGADSMFHVNKGVIAYRFGGVKYLGMKKCYGCDIGNVGFLGNETITPSLKLQDSKYYLGAETFGVCLACCKDVTINDFYLKKIKSNNGNSVGIITMNKSENVCISYGKIKGVRAGQLVDGEWKGTNYYGETVSYDGLKRNSVPQAVGIYIHDNCDVSIGCVNICDLKSPKKPKKVKYGKCHC